MATTSKPPSNQAAQGQQKTLMKLAIKELVAVNFQCPPAILEKHLPKGLELDYFGNDTYLSLQCMLVKKPGLVSNPFSRGFVNLSLQFYVRRINDHSQTGMCGIRNYVGSSSASRFLASKLGGRADKLKIKYSNSGFGGKKGQIPEVDYQWKVDEHWNKLRIRARERIKNTGPETKVGFILRHFNLYKAIDGRTFEYKAQHPIWTVWDAAQASFTCDVQHLFGKEFVKPLGRRPASVFVSDGCEIKYFRPQQIA